MFSAASVLTASVLVVGLGIGLVAHVFAGAKAPQGDCATRVARTNVLVEKAVLAALPTDRLRSVNPARVADLDAADCAWDDWPGGIQALWNGGTGAATVRLLEQGGWQRTDPAGGPPGWFVRDEQADDRLDVGMSDGDAIVLTKKIDHRRIGISATRVGLAAWAE